MQASRRVRCAIGGSRVVEESVEQFAMLWLDATALAFYSADPARGPYCGPAEFNDNRMLS